LVPFVTESIGQPRTIQISDVERQKKKVDEIKRKTRGGAYSEKGGSDYSQNQDFIEFVEFAKNLHEPSLHVCQVFDVFQVQLCREKQARQLAHTKGNPIPSPQRFSI